MQRLALFVSTLLLTLGTAQANEKFSHQIPSAEIQLEIANLSASCQFKGESYSQGALLEVGRVILVCAPKNSYETNGQLMWIDQSTIEAAEPKVRVTGSQMSAPTAE